MPRILKSGPGIGFLDNRYVQVTGDTMTGQLVLGLAGTGLSITQDAVMGGYLRIGSTSAPANTTAGDLSVSRINIGNFAQTLDVIGIVTTINSSSNNYRGIRCANTYTGSGAGPADIEAHPIFQPSVSISVCYGLINIAKADPDTGVTITNIHGGAYRVDTGGLAGAVTNAQAMTTLTSTLGSLKPGSIRGFLVQSVYPTASSAGTTNVIGIDLNAQGGGTSISECLRVNYPYAGTGVGSVTSCFGIDLPT